MHPARQPVLTRGNIRELVATIEAAIEQSVDHPTDPLAYRDGLRAARQMVINMWHAAEIIAAGVDHAD